MSRNREDFILFIPLIIVFGLFFIAAMFFAPDWENLEQKCTTARGVPIHTRNGMHCLKSELFVEGFEPQ